MSPRKGFVFIFLLFTLFSCFILYHSVRHIQLHEDTSSPVPIPITTKPINISPGKGESTTPGKDDNKIDDKSDAELPIILYWTAVSSFMGRHMLKSPEKCPVKCEFTETQSKLPKAGAVVFLLPAVSSGTHFPHKHPNQSFVGLSMESEMYYTQMKDKKFMSNFDIKMTYRLSSDIPTLYVSSNANYSNTPDPKTTEALATVFVSNSGPLNARNEAVQALMDLIPIHSYGRYLHNKDIPHNETKKSILRKYKFHLAFENSNSQDYVTEKVFHALAAGTVPVYMGAPNIDIFVPSNRSIIKVSDFESYEKLADYLKYLDTHEDEYQKYLDWKLKDYSENFKKIKQFITTDSRCKLCMKLHGLPIPKLQLS